MCISQLRGKQTEYFSNQMLWLDANADEIFNSASFISDGPVDITRGSASCETFNQTLQMSLHEITCENYVEDRIRLATVHNEAGNKQVNYELELWTNQSPEEIYQYLHFL